MTSLHREQRLTRTLAFVMIGISILLTPVLCHVPLPVLYGIFLYMGVNVLKAIQVTLCQI
jgi:sodium bicarbonate transporter 10